MTRKGVMGGWMHARVPELDPGWWCRNKTTGEIADTRLIPPDRTDCPDTSRTGDPKGTVTYRMNSYSPLASSSTEDVVKRCEG